MRINELPKESLEVLRRGSVIPAHLLALDADRHHYAPR